jgi:small subunit ribosomal protein S11
MGKKRIIKEDQEKLVKEKEKVEAEVQKEKKIEVPTARIRDGKIYISSSYNNTIISLADLQGRVLAWVSAGSIGFKGAKKATPFAASKVAEAIFQTISKLGIEKLSIVVKGVGGGRESAVRSFAAKGLDIVSVTDKTPVPHNGCRARKARRV